MAFFTFAIGTTDVPLSVFLADGYGPLLGEMPTVTLRQASTGLFLDFADDTFKLSGHILRDAPLQDLGNGTYQRIWDSSVAIIEDQHLIAEYTNTGVNAHVSNDIIFFVTPDACELQYCVKDEVTDEPIPGVDVWVTTDPQGNTVIAGTSITDKDGCVVFFLDPDCTYFFFRQKAGYNFDNPDVQTIGPVS